MRTSDLAAERDLGCSSDERERERERREERSALLEAVR